jgi:transcriptional regulator with XRE-family HTH domain
MLEFGTYVRERRETLRQTDAAFSLRQLAQRIGVEPSYLSKVERGAEAPPSEAKIRRLAEELGEDPDVLLALAGKVSSDLMKAIRKRPKLFARLIRDLADLPDHAVLRIVREVRDGTW